MATTKEVKAAVLKHLGLSADGQGEKVEMASLRKAFRGTQSAVVHLGKDEAEKLL